jgi:hypothetical protein
MALGLASGYLSRGVALLAARRRSTASIIGKASRGKVGGRISLGKPGGALFVFGAERRAGLSVVTIL